MTEKRMNQPLSSAPSSASEVEIEHTQCFIGGEWVPSSSGKTFPVINPATEEEIAQVAEGDAADVDAAAKAARRAFESGDWPKMDARDRGRLLDRLADRMKEEFFSLVGLEVLNTGKAIRDCLRADLPLSIETFRYYAGYADKIHGKTIPIRGDFLCYTRREPVGVAGQIIPWNYPLLMMAWKWAPALAAGCTIVMKPAEQTPLTCLRMAQLAKEVGFPDGVINVVPGYGPTAGAACVKHPLIDKIAFTGEYRTAQSITRDSADTLKRLSFELGGKSPNIVFADADLDAAVQGASFGIFLNGGQCCTAGSRLFVEKRCYDEFMSKLLELTRSRVVGDPFSPETQQGAQIDDRQFEKILRYIDQGKSEGASCIAGGSRHGDRGYFIEPTIFENVRDEMSIATDEIFGPVLTVMSFDDMDDLVGRANDTFYGLVAAVWTSSLAKAHHLAERVRAGTVWINCYNALDAAAPFGGFKMSGYGRELGEDGLNLYTENKTVTVKL